MRGHVRPVYCVALAHGVHCAVVHVVEEGAGRVVVEVARGWEQAVLTTDGDRQRPGHVAPAAASMGEQQTPLEA